MVSQLNSQTQVRNTDITCRIECRCVSGWVSQRWVPMRTTTFIIQQHIFRFEVSVDDSFLVEVLQALNDLGCVVAGPWLLEPWVVLVHVINVIPGCRRELTEFDQMCWTNRRQKSIDGCC